MAVGFGCVALTDDDLLFEFTHRAEALAEARADLEKFGDTYRLQLIAAMFLTHQAAHLEELRAGDQLHSEKHPQEYWDGYTTALRHTAEGLRDGEYLPGGQFHDETIAGTAF